MSDKESKDWWAEWKKAFPDIEHKPVTFHDNGHYCGGCGMRKHMCWCGESRGISRRYDNDGWGDVR